MLLSTLMTGGLAVYAMADTQEAESGAERVGESSFNLGEAAATAQVFQLSRAWPGTAATAYPASCNQASIDPGCPDPGNLESSFDSSDYGEGTTWTTSVRDNGGQAGSFYSDTVAAGQPSYDASGPKGLPDGNVWVRAEATVRGRTRKMVTLVSSAEVQRPFPRKTITAGWFRSTNNGNKVIVDTNGPSNEFEAGALSVRCTTPARSLTCLDYEASKGQIEPSVVETGAEAVPAVPPKSLDELRTLAASRGTYYATGCPSSLSGDVVFIEDGDCSYTGNGLFNSPSDPGLVTVARGTLALGGTVRFHGVVYAANAQRSTVASPPVVRTFGNANVFGAIAVDGEGGVEAGSSGVNVSYNPNVFAAVKGYGNAFAVQGSWRELTDE